MYMLDISNNYLLMNNKSEGIGKISRTERRVSVMVNGGSGNRLMRFNVWVVLRSTMKSWEMLR